MKRILTILLLLPAFAFSQATKEVSTYPVDTVTSNYLNTIQLFGSKNGTYFNYKLYDVIKSKADVNHVHTFSSLTSKPNTLGGYGITDAVPATRTISINGTTLDLSANRSYTVSGGSGSQTLQQTTTLGNTTTDDIEITSAVKGAILKSPNGTRWRITIGNDGALTTTAL
jgi:hypothetical protein